MSFEANTKLRVEYQLDVDNVSEAMQSIIECIEFWNREIRGNSMDTIYQSNLRTMSANRFRAYQLDLVLGDCRIISRYHCGRSGSHVCLH